MTKAPWPQGVCLKCKGILLRIDGIPLCWDCEQKAKEQAAKTVKKIDPNKPIELYPDVVTDES